MGKVKAGAVQICGCEDQAASEKKKWRVEGTFSCEWAYQHFIF